MEDCRETVRRERMAQGESKEPKRAGVSNDHPPCMPSPVHLAGSPGLSPCLQHVWQQAWAQAALLFETACNATLAPSASRGACGGGLDQSALRHTARHNAPGLQQRDELPLGLRIALDVPLGHRQARMTSEFLHVPETAPDL
jgi:hypothetical protein